MSKTVGSSRVQEAEEGQISDATPQSMSGVQERDHVTISNVSHWYATRNSQVQALDDVSLHIHAGDFVCVVGASGCGKTTLMQMLAGFVKPSQGKVLVGDHEVTRPDPERGVVFQQPNLFPWLSVRDNVSFGPRMHKEPKSAYAPRVDRLLDLVGLSEFADRAPYELSGGMQQRAAIARVLVNQPAIILMDEPFGALDALTRDRMQEELLQIWRELGSTIFFITHSVEEAVYLGTRVAVMSARPGRIILDKDVKLLSKERGDDAQSVRASREFASLREEISSAIYRGHDC